MMDNGTMDISARYERARNLMRDFQNTDISINSSMVPNWIEDSDAFFYSRESRCGKEFRLVVPSKEKNLPAFDHESLARALGKVSGQEVKANDLPINGVEIDATHTVVVFSAFGKRWQFDCKHSECKELTSNPSNWLVSPDGKKAVFTRDHDLWVVDIASKNETALTCDGEKHYAYSNVPERVDIVSGLYPPTGEQLPQALWSPDSKKVFTFQVDERQVLPVSVTAYAPSDGSLRPKTWQPRYPFPGDKHIVEYRMLIIDVDSIDAIDARHPRVLDTGGPQPGVFAHKRAWWSADSSKAYFVELSRYDKEARVVAMDAQTGICEVLFEEHSDTYLELTLFNENPVSIGPLPATNELVWFSERTGSAHLYLYDLDTGREIRALTTGDWLVSEVVKIDANRREVFFQAMGRVPDRDPYYREVCRVNIDTSEITTLASSDHDYICHKPGSIDVLSANVFGAEIGDNSCGISLCGDYIVVTRTRVDQPAVSELRGRDGGLIMALESADIDLPQGWRWPEPVKLLAADGKTEIFGTVFRPSDFDPDKKYPVIDYVQALPISRFVPKGSFFSDAFSLPSLSAQALAELGSIVVMIDARGSSMRDKAFHDESYGRIHTGSNLEDHIAGIKQLSEIYPYLDLNRVGITHAGGCNAPVYGLLAFPEFYRVGVACSVFDTRMLIGMEQYQGSPDAEIYDILDYGDLAENLEGKLLIIQGMMDNFYHVAGAFQLIEALIQKNKNFDSLFMPNGPHMFRDGYSQRRAWDYLVEHLIGETPPRNFKLKSILEK